MMCNTSDKINSLYTKHNDPYLVIKNMLPQYKECDFDDVTEFKCYIINILEDVYDKNIDEAKLNDYLKQTNISLDRTPQEKFRQKLINKYKSCIVTGDHPDECEASHIVPLKDKHNFDVNNGLLLSSSLHKLFDKFIWSIDDNNKIVVRPDTKQYLIKQFEDKTLNLDKDVMNKLKWHYQQFLEKCNI